MVYFLYFMMVVGAFMIFSAAINLEWFFKQRRAQTLVKLMGPNGARIFYSLMGLMFVIFSWMALTGRIEIHSVF